MGAAMVIYHIPVDVQVTMPLLFTQAGWLTNVLMMTLIYLLSTVAATMLCEAMQRIPGNFTFDLRFAASPLIANRTQIRVCHSCSPLLGRTRVLGIPDSVQPQHAGLQHRLHDYFCAGS